MSVARGDDTAPIDLTAGQRRVLRTRAAAAKGDEDAPRVGEVSKSPSALIEDAFKASAEIGRAADRGETPTPEQIKRMQDGALVFQVLRDRLVDMATSGGGGRSGGWLPVIVAVLASLGITIGGPALTSADDIATTKVRAEQTAADVTELKEWREQDDAEDAEQERSIRRNLGLTIRWLGDEQVRHCENNEAIAEGVNWLVKRELARKGDNDAEFEPIKIDCKATKLLPPELDKLRADAPYDDE